MTSVTPYGDTDELLSLLLDIESDAYALKNVIKLIGTYTFSIWHKSDKENTITFNFFGKTEETISTTEWKKYTKTITVSSLDDTDIYIKPGLNVNTFLYEAFLSEGTLDTSWTPAPEDVDDSVLSVRSELSITADEIKNMVSANDGRIAQLITNLNGIYSYVKDSDENIGKLEVTANQVKAEVESARGDSASLSIALDGIRTTIKNVEGDYSSLEVKIDEIETAVKSREQISYEGAGHPDTLSSEWIKDGVENDYVGAIYIDTDTGYLYRWTLIGDVYQWRRIKDGDLSIVESSIKQNADEIALRVKEEDVDGNYLIGKINLTSTTATIAAKNINLSGAVTFSSLADDLSTEVSYIKDISELSTENAEVISSWTINDTYINGACIYTGSITADKIAAGAITADKIEALSITSDKINVDELFSKEITATNLHITGNSTFEGTGSFKGNIIAQTGQIGSLLIDENGFLTVENEKNDTYMSLNSTVYNDDEELGVEGWIYNTELRPGSIMLHTRILNGNGGSIPVHLSSNDGLSWGWESCDEYSSYYRRNSCYINGECTVDGRFNIIGWDDPEYYPTFNGHRIRHAGNVMHKTYTSSSDYITFWNSSTYFTTNSVDFYYDNATGRVEIFGNGKIGSTLSGEWGCTLCKVALPEFQPKRNISFSVSPAYSSKTLANGILYKTDDADNPGELRCFGQKTIGEYYIYFTCSYYVDANLLDFIGD